MTMKKGFRKAMSIVLAMAMAVGLAVTGGGGNVHQVEAASIPAKQDSVSAINYKQVLGGGVDYGIIANSITQHSHMETTFATKTFTNTSGANNDVDYIQSTALFLIQDLTPGSKIYWGKSTASAMYLEAPAAVFGDDFDPNYDMITKPNSSVNGNIQFGGSYGYAPVIQNVNPDAKSNVERLIKRINNPQTPEDADQAWSYYLSERARNPEYVLNPDGDNCEYFSWVGDPHGDGKAGEFTISIDNDDFKGKVVYINLTSKMLNALKRNGAFNIEKDPSTVVVFNIEEAAVTDDVLCTDAEHANPYLRLDKPKVKSNGSTYVGTTDINGNNDSYGWDDNSDDVNAEAVQKVYNETVIWNVMTEKDVLLSSMGGAMLLPKTSYVDISQGNVSGWIVTGADLDVHCEFHFLYSGSSKDQKGQIHFAVNKAFTRQYNSIGHVEQDASVEIQKGDYEFFWQEYEDDSYNDNKKIGDKEVISVDSEGAALFPMLTFTYTDSNSKYYIEKPNTGSVEKDYFFMVTENPDKTVAGVTNSDGNIKIKLTVKLDSNGNFTYFVDYDSITGENIVYASYDGIKMSGVQFDLGRFYNKSLDTGTLELTKKVVGIDDENAYKDIDYKVAIKTEINGQTYYVTDERGTLSTTKTYLTIKAGDSNKLTVKNLLLGVYELEENEDSAKITGYDLKSVYFAPATRTIENDKEVKTSTLTNTYEDNGYITTGELSITKTVSGYNGTDDEYTFYVKEKKSNKYLTTLSTGELGEKTPFTIKAGETITFRNVLINTYEKNWMGIYHNNPTYDYIIEEDDSANKTGYDLRTIIKQGDQEKRDGVISFKPDWDENNRVWINKTASGTIENNYNVHKSSLKIKKEVTGLDSYTGTKPASYSVTVQNKTTSEYVQNKEGKLDANIATLNVPANGTLEIKNLPVGDYIVTEDKVNAKIAGYALTVTGDGEVTIPDQKPPVAGEITIKNDYKESKSVISITATKNFVDLSGKNIALSGGEFAFQITNHYPLSVNQTVYNDANGNIAFDDITIPDTIKNTIIEFKIQELNYLGSRANDPQITYDSGEYVVNVTVDEDGNVTNIEHQNDIVFNNVEQTGAPVNGSLEIHKTLTGERTWDDVKSYLSFDVTGDNNYSKTINGTDDGWTISTDKKTATYKISAIELGKYSVSEKNSETTDTSNYTVEVKCGSSSSVLSDGSTVSDVELSSTSSEKDVYFNNAYSIKTGNLTFTKTVVGPVEQDEVEGALTFQVTTGTGADKKYVTADGTLTATETTLKLLDKKNDGTNLFTYDSTSKKWTATFENLPVGTYTVDETNTAIKIKGTDTNYIYKSTVTTDTETLTTNGGTLELTDEYEKPQEVGNLTFTKTVVGPVEQDEVEGALTFQVTTGTGADKKYVTADGTLTATETTLKLLDKKNDGTNLFTYDSTSKKWTATFENLPVGTYTVDETNTAIKIKGTDTNYIYKSTVTTDTETLTTNGGTLELTDEYEKPQEVGSLTFTKTVVGPVEQDEVEGALTFQVTTGTGADKKYVTADGTLTATETTLKLLDKKNDGTNLFTYDSTSKKWTATFENLPVGTYTVDETNTAIKIKGTDTNYIYKSTVTTDTETLTTNGGTLELTDEYEKPQEVGNLTFTKTVVGPVEQDEVEGALTFQVTTGTGADKKYVTADGTLTATETTLKLLDKKNDGTNLFTYDSTSKKWTATFENLPVGTYTVDETNTAIKIKGTDTNYIYKSTVTTDTETLTTNGGTLELTDEYEKPQEVGNLTFTKTVVGPVEQDEVEGALTFQVTTGTGADKKYVTADGTLTATETTLKLLDKKNDGTNLFTYDSTSKKWTATFENLPVGTYTVDETNTAIKIKGTDTNYIYKSTVTTDTETLTTNGGTLELTDEYEKPQEVGNLTFTKTVVGPVEQDEVEGALTFQVTTGTGADKKYVTADGTLTATETTLKLLDKKNDGTNLFTYDSTSKKWTATFENLPVGTYTVDETNTAIKIKGTDTNYIYKSTVTTDTETLTTNGGTLELTDEYEKPQEVGNLTFTKTVVGPVEQDEVEGALTFQVTTGTGADKKYVTADGTLTATETTLKLLDKKNDGTNLFTYDSTSKKWTATFENLPVGTYTVDETNTAIKIKGTDTNYIYKSTVTTDTETLTTNGGTLELTDEYEKPQEVGKLVIQKTIDGAGLTDLDDIKFTISPAINNVSELTLNKATYSTVGWVTSLENGLEIYKYTFDNVPVDSTVTYTVTETADGSKAGYVCTTAATDKVKSGSVINTSGRMLEIKNTYETTGNLTFTKTVVGPVEQDEVEGALTFQVTTGTGADKKYVTADGTLTATETTLKLLDKKNDGTNLFTYDSTSKKWTATFENLPVGTYTVDETNTAIKIKGTDTNYIYKSTVTTDTETLTTNGGTLELTDEYEKPQEVGNLTFTKTVVGPVEQDEVEGALTFQVTTGTGADKKYVTADGTLTATETTLKLLDKKNDGTNLFTYDSTSKKWTATFENLPVGTYTVDETNTAIKIKGTDTNYIYKSTVTTDTETLTTNGGTLELTDEYEKPQEVGNLTFTKTVVGPVEQDEVEGALTFQVTTGTGADKKYVTADGTLTATETTLKLLDKKNDGTNLFTYDSTSKKWTATFENLPVGTYTVDETNTAIKIKGTDTNYIYKSTVTTDTETLTTNGGTLELTDEYEKPQEVGNLTFTKTVVGPVEQDEVEGALTFQVTTGTGADKKYVTADGTLTATETTLKLLDKKNDGTNLFTYDSTSKKWTATFENLPVGTYTVDETNTAIKIKGTDTNYIYKSTVTTDTETLTTNGGTLELTDEYEKPQEVGNLTFTKTVVGPVEQDEVEGALTFQVTTGTGADKKYVTADGTLTATETTLKLLDKKNDGTNLFTYDSTSKKWTATFENLPVGTYTVDETNTAIKIKGTDTNYIYKSTVTTDTETLTTNGGTLELTDEYEKPQEVGNLTFTKTVVGPVEQDEVEGALTFQVTTGTGADKKYVTADGTLTATETTLKLLDKKNDGTNLFTYDSTSKKWTATFENLPVGTYTVDETNTAIKIKGTDTNYIYKSTVTTDTETLTTNGGILELTDEYEKPQEVGNLTFTKTVVGPVEQDEVEGALTFQVTTGTGVDKKYVTADGTLTATETTLKLLDKKNDGTNLFTYDSTSKKWTATFENLPVGNYTVDETNTAIKIKGTDTNYIYKSTVTTDTETLTTNGGTLELTDEYEKPQTTGSLTITKTVTSPLTEDEYNGKLYFVISKYEGQDTTGYIQDKNGTIDASTVKNFTIVDDFTPVSEVDNGDGTTTRTYTLEINNVPFGNYRVTETNDDIANYELSKTITPDSVTIDGNNLTGNVNITDVYTENSTTSKGKIYITKNDAVSMKELENAHIEVYTAAGVYVDDWDTTTTAHELSVEAGDYVMRETGAPDGYQQVTTEIAFKVIIDANNNVKVECTDTNVKINDQDASKIALLDQPLPGTLVVSKTISNTSLNELETISFTITDGDGKAVVDVNGKTVSIPDLTTANVTAGTWTDAGNGKYTYTITDIPANTKCVVTETLDGHTSTYTLDTANSKTNGDATVTAGGTVYVELTDAYTKVEKKYDKEVKISKVDATNKKELAGCQLQLFTIDANGNQVSKANGGVFEEWTSSDTKVYTFKLTAGDYAIKELVAPEGYQKREDLYKFRLSFDDKGNAKITTLAGPGEYNEAEDRIEFNDDPIKVETETGGMKVTVQEEGTGRNVPNATVEIEAPSGTSFPDGSSKITVTTDENGQITSYKDKDGKVIDLTTGLTPGDYKVTVTKVPDGYKVTTGQTKTVTVKKGEVAEHLALIGTAKKDDNTETKTEQPTTEKQPTTEVKQPSTTTTPNAPSTPQKDSTVVNTGDSMNVVPIIVVMILALIGIIVLIIKKRKMRYEY